MGGRFKSPVMPGETLEVHAWEDDGPDGPGSGRILFQTRVGDRVVFDAGVMTRRA
jgi:acyl dehydratase